MQWNLFIYFYKKYAYGRKEKCFYAVVLKTLLTVLVNQKLRVTLPCENILFNDWTLDRPPVSAKWIFLLSQ